jgi:hypothetical protein
VVGLATQHGDHLAALADDLAPDAIGLEHEPPVRLRVVVARLAGTVLDRPDIYASCHLWRFDTAPTSPTGAPAPAAAPQSRVGAAPPSPLGEAPSPLGAGPLGS